MSDEARAYTAPAVTREQLTAVVRELVVKNATSRSSITDQDRLGNIGFDSLDVVELAIDIEKELERDVADADCPRGNDTISDIVGRIARAWSIE